MPEQNPNPVRKPPGTPKRWTEENIRRELAAFLQGRTQWPSRREFEQAGKGALLTALTKNGGGGVWARRLGFEPRAGGDERRWTEERIRAELVEFIAGHPTFPTHAEFRRAGRGQLYAAARVYRGLASWRQELGFAPRGRGRSRTWSEQRIEEELRPLLTAGRFPPKAAFARAGKLALYWAVQRHGGAAAWAARLGVAAPRPDPRAGAHDA